MKKKVLVFMPGDEANVKLHFKCSKTTVLRIEVIEIDNPNVDSLINFEL